MQFKRLFSPFTIKNMTLKNRVVIPAVHHLYTPDGSATPRFVEYYNRRAEGGAGLIIVGGCKFDDYGGTTAMMSLADDDKIPGWTEFTKGIHERNCKIGVQLYHAGRYAKQKNLPEGKEALSASAVYSKYSKETPKAMTIEEIKEVTQKWAAAAKRAKISGFDCVEILGSAGYLIAQFLSPITNQRTDEYGGSWENRCRFPLEVIQAVRAAVGDEYPLILRQGGNDFMVGGNDNDNAIDFAILAEKAGIDLLDVTGGWHETEIPQLPSEVPRAGYSYLANAIKKAVSIPVLTCNRINDPCVAEEVLALERGDLVGVARGFIADPNWAIKAQEGRPSEIRKCVACNQGCLAKTFFAKPIECLVNGYAGREYLMPKEEKTSDPKKLLVIGSGPGGSEFAIAAATRGHDVTIWEKEDCLGGQLRWVEVPPGKEEFHNLIDYHTAMIKKLGITVVYNKEGTKENIAEAGFDEVVIAAGVLPNMITLPGQTPDMMVVSANDVLAQNVMPGKKVVVVGGGSVGCETAQYLASKGSLSKDQLMFLSVQKAEKQEKIDFLLNTSDRNISIVEVTKGIGSGFDLGTGWPILKDLKRLGVKQYTFAQIKSVANNVMVIEKGNKNDDTTEKVEIPFDTIVLAVGSKPNNALYNSLVDGKIPVHQIGDSKMIGKVLDAIRQADDLALSI